MKVQVLKKRKKMWAHEGPWKKKKKDSHALNRIYIGREIIQKEFPFHPSQSMHVHILIWLYDLFFSLDPVFDFAIHVIQVCVILHALPWAPHIAIVWGRMKERQVKCLGEDTYTLSDLIESNEELRKVYFENSLKKTPSYLTWGVEVIWFATIPFLNYPRWHDRHFKVHKYKVWVGISLMLASYLWKSCSTLVLSASLKDEQSLSVGELLTALKYQI